LELFEFGFWNFFIAFPPCKVVQKRILLKMKTFTEDCSSGPQQHSTFLPFVFLIETFATALAEVFWLQHTKNLRRDKGRIIATFFNSARLVLRKIQTF
jgi:hypothetical protein